MLTIVGGVVAAVLAATDWWSVWRGKSHVEQFAKPAVMVALLVLSLSVDADPAASKWLVAIGLLFGLAGDVFLLPQVDQFLAGLGAFLIGHCFYIAAFLLMDLAFIGIVGGCAAGVVLLTYLGWPIIKKVRGGPYGVPVIAYLAVVLVLVVVATATHRWPIAAGGVFFAVSDGLLGLDRFVRPAPYRRVLVHMLYHLGQAGFVVGLVWMS
jgi:alkenylglycerophosphocholine/alkenylglycerophosphoethanolamine hydrolase